MELKDLGKTINELPEGQRGAILDIIEHKTNNDMKEVIAKMDSEFKSINSKFDNKFDSVKNEIKIVYWVIGIAMAIMIYFVAKK